MKNGIRRLAIFGILLLVVLMGMTGAVSAQSPQFGGDINIEEDEVVGDRLLIGGDITVAGTVEGDLTVIGGSISITETAEITGTLEIIGGAIQFDGTVDGNAELTAGAVDIGESGTIGGDTQVAADRLTVFGTIHGTLEAAVDSLILADTATIDGDVRYSESASVDQDEAATIGGEVVESDDLERTGEISGISFPDLGPLSWGGLLSAYVVAVWLLLGAIILLVLPQFGDQVVQEVTEHSLRSVGVGFVCLFVIPAALVMLAFTIIGIPLTFLGFMAFGLLAAIAVVLGRYAIGAWALAHLGIHNRWAALIVGIVGMAILGLIPYLGWLLNFVVFLLGFGAIIVLGAKGIQHYRSAESGI